QNVFFPKSLRCLVCPAGFEPATFSSGVKGRRIATYLKFTGYISSKRRLHRGLHQSGDGTQRRPACRVRGEPDHRATPPARRPADGARRRGCLMSHHRSSWDRREQEGASLSTARRRPWRDGGGGAAITLPTCAAALF